MVTRDTVTPSPRLASISGYLALGFHIRHGLLGRISGVVPAPRDREGYTLGFGIRHIDYECD